jgi:hypothetical protein
MIVTLTPSMVSSGSMISLAVLAAIPAPLMGLTSSRKRRSCSARPAVSARRTGEGRRAAAHRGRLAVLEGDVGLGVRGRLRPARRGVAEDAHELLVAKPLGELCTQARSHTRKRVMVHAAQRGANREGRVAKVVRLQRVGVGAAQQQAGHFDMTARCAVVERLHARRP